MSQAGIVDIEGSHPQIPTSFVTDDGTAIPIANVLEILGTTVAAHSIPIRTTGSGNTVTIEAQYASAAASSVATNAGFASFDSTFFTVDANGFVTFNGSAGTEAFEVDASTAPGTNPVVPDSFGHVTVTGGQVAAGTTTNVIRTDSLAANTYTIQIQRSQAVASSTIGDNGVSHFNSTYFTVDANGFVSLNGASVGETITGDVGGALSPTSGNWNILGTSTAAGTTPVQTSGSVSTLTVQVQKSQAIASTNATNVGLAAFSSAQFAVDANGFVTFNGSAVATTYDGNSGSATPALGVLNLVGNNGVITSATGNTVTFDMHSPFTGGFEFDGPGISVVNTGSGNIDCSLTCDTGNPAVHFTGNGTTFTFANQAGGFVGYTAGSSIVSVDATSNPSWNFSKHINVSGGSVISGVSPTYSLTNDSNNFWIFGADVANSGNFVLSSGAVLGTSNVISITSAGVITITGSIVIGNISISANTISVTNANGTLDILSNGTGTITVGANATSHQSTFGSVSGTSSTTIQSGSGALAVTSTNGTLTINSGTGALGLSTDASNTTVSLGTGAAVKTVVIGSTNTSSSTSIKVGTNGFDLSSASVSILSSTSAGVITAPNAINAGGGAPVAVGSNSWPFQGNVSNAGNTVVIGVANLDNTNSGSDASFILNVGGTSAGDPYVSYGGPASQWTHGIDNSDSASFKIGTGGTPSSATNSMKFYSTGPVTIPRQPCFMAYPGAVTGGVTGAGTTVTVPCNTANYNIGSNYNTSTYTYTAPVSGRHQFDLSCFLDSLLVANNVASLILVTTSITATVAYLNPFPSSTSGLLMIGGSIIVSMAAGDTAKMQVTVSGGAADTVRIQGSGPNTFFAGFLAN